MIIIMGIIIYSAEWRKKANEEARIENAAFVVKEKTKIRFVIC